MIASMRRLVYRLGIRPKPGTIWFSPTLALNHSFKEAFALLRPGLWCGRCMRSAAFEQAVFDGGALVATLQGCPTCLTGIFAVKEYGHG